MWQLLVTVGFGEQKIDTLVAGLINMIDNVQLETHLIKPEFWLLIVCS